MGGTGGMGGVDAVGAGGGVGMAPDGPSPKFKNASKPASANIIKASILTRIIRLRFCVFCLRSLVRVAGGNSKGAM